MTSLTELIEALREAKEGSRELDAAIVRLLYPEANIDFYCVGDEEKVVFHAEPLVTNKHTIPHFTTSLDAALTLVPEGFAWSVKALNVEGDMEYHGQFNFEKPAYAATPALALCIAALSSIPEGDLK